MLRELGLKLTKALSEQSTKLKQTFYPYLLSLKTSSANLFLKITFFDIPKGFEEEMTVLSKKIDENGQLIKKNKIHDAIFSKNTLVAIMGLGLGYIGVNFFQFWVATGGFVLGYLIFPITVYVVASLLQARAVFIKNLAYEERKRKYNELIAKKIDAIMQKAKLAFTFGKHKQFPTSTELFTFNTTFNANFKEFTNKKTKEILKNADDHFNKSHAKYIAYQEMQHKLEPVKKFTRVLMLFTAIFALQAAELMFSGFIIPSLFLATAFAYIDYKSKEITHDIKLKRLQDRLLYLKKLELANSQPKDLLQQVKYPDAIKSIQYSPLNYAKYLDYLLAFLGITSAYAAISLGTVFNIHQMKIFTSGQSLFNLGLGGISAAEAFLFGGAGLIAVGIMLWTCYRTWQLYQFYEQEEIKIRNENARLEAEVKHLTTEHTLTLDKSHTMESEPLKESVESSKLILNIGEAIKKTMRVMMYLVIFGLVGSTNPIASAFIGIAGAIAIVIGIFDFLSRQNKTKIEETLTALKTTQLNLLEDKQQLLNKYQLQNNNSIVNNDEKPDHNSAFEPTNTMQPNNGDTKKDLILNPETKAVNTIQPNWADNKITRRHSFSSYRPTRSRELNGNAPNNKVTSDNWVNAYVDQDKRRTGPLPVFDRASLQQQSTHTVADKSDTVLTTVNPQRTSTFLPQPIILIDRASLQQQLTVAALNSNSLIQPKSPPQPAVNANTHSAKIHSHSPSSNDGYNGETPQSTNPSPVSQYHWPALSAQNDVLNTNQIHVDQTATTQTLTQTFVLT